ncbi:MAG: ABC transporter permease [Alphaproteobacteria bacterium]|nr:ABC transporter permease [Alphaproteobacteria bacterium]
MASLVLGRLLLGAVTLLVASLLVFAGTQALPGDVTTAILGNEATPETRAALVERLGLDHPIHVQYFEWAGRFLRGDLGLSLVNDVPVSRLLDLRLKNTFILALATIIVVVPLSLFLGLLCAAYPNGRLDSSISVVSLFLISLPEFLVGIILVLLFAVYWSVLPATSISGFRSFEHLVRALVLPVLTLTFAILAHMVRMTRAAMLEVMRAPYIEMALLKGASRSRIVLRHALPNALGPIINVIALNLGYLISGVVVVEVIFAYPGLGKLLVEAIGNRDLPLLQAVALIMVAAYIVFTLLADIVARLSNPRLRFKQ